MKKTFVIILLSAFVCFFSMCRKTDMLTENGHDDDRLSGGDATTFDSSSNAFQVMITGLSSQDQSVHNFGDDHFDQVFEESLTSAFGGLGPVFNNVSCISCHRNDGGGLPTTGLESSGLLVRISISGTDAYGGPVAAPGFGLQVQDRSVTGAKQEADIKIGYAALNVSYPDGRIVTLQKPTVGLENPYIPLPVNYMLSPRLSGPLVGLGLLENIPEQTILNFIDAGDKNGDGITGKANYAYDVYTKKRMLGRFGFKLNTPTLLTQVAAAYQQDMGITSYVFPQESCEGQSQMNVLTGIASTLPDLPDSVLNAVTFYMRTLAVPARRDIANLDVMKGAALFNQVNCANCHRTSMQTGISADLPQLSNQRIHPYTDLLLHDMGDGLADDRPDYQASGKEWRTTPLWGIGLHEKINGTTYYLHDGRARNIEEAILWHDGEAARAKNSFIKLSVADRSKLLKFINSL